MDVKEIKDLVKAAEIDTIRMDYADLYGICRTKVFPASRLEETLEEGINFAKAVYALDLANDVAPATGCGEDVDWEDMTVIPDPTTFALMPHQPHTGRFIGEAFKNGQPFPVDPRRVLKNVLARYEEKNLRPVAASELEFFLFREGEQGYERYCDRPSSVYQVSPRVDDQDLMRTLQNMFVQLGFQIIYLNHEFFKSQYEVNWKYEHALTMADQTFTFKHVCKEVAHQHGLLLTFMDRPRNDAGSNGYHLHLSLSDPETRKNLFDDPKGPHGMSELMRYFIGGQMAHAKGMAALLSPNINAYKRFLPDSFAPYFLLWGLDNRTVYLRVPSERGRGTRVENRAPGASANPYLAFAAVFAAGLDGIEKKIDPGEPFIGDGYRVDPEKYELVPMTLVQAIEHLKKDEVLCEALGAPAIKAFLALKEHEIGRFQTYVTDWEFNEYAYPL